ncbi:hypothetical protein V6N11_021645 [Hibiscus sabdariffa]|uniref:Uncharacterized protein n=2 Tax=Hibiscus sabdariffa TaxID=183260 RepID=A0ABR2PBI2_9ROSI
MWVASSMVLLAFPDVDTRQRLLSQQVLSTWFGHLEEAKLVRVPTVEQREGRVSSEGGWGFLSPLACEPTVGHRQWWEGLWGSLSAVGAAERVVYDRGGVCSAGEVDCDIMGVRSREVLVPERMLVSNPDLDSVDSEAQGSSCVRVVELDNSVANTSAMFPLLVLVGYAEAAVVPVVGTAKGGDRKVKSVNSLVEALGSPAQQRVITATSSKRGRGRSAKGVVVAWSISMRKLRMSH